jgi:group I intron endonuclease
MIHSIEIPDIEKIGVYAIYNKKTNKYYVGSTVNLKRRLNEHKKKIESLQGTNYLMEEDLKSDEDIENFSFIVLETFEDFEITDIELRKRENFYIEKYDCYNGYNTTSAYCNGFYGKNELLRSKPVIQGKVDIFKIMKMTNRQLLNCYANALTGRHKNNDIVVMA